MYVCIHRGNLLITVTIIYPSASGVCNQLSKTISSQSNSVHLCSSIIFPSLFHKKERIIKRFIQNSYRYPQADLIPKLIFFSSATCLNITLKGNIYYFVWRMSPTCSNNLWANQNAIIFMVGAHQLFGDQLPWTLRFSLPSFPFLPPSLLPSLPPFVPSFSLFLSSFSLFLPL